MTERECFCPWDLAALAATPSFSEDPSRGEGDIKAIFYDGLPWRGRPTRVFAYYAVPERASAGEKVPAMVLVHGGGGSAYVPWVRLWLDRGYAAVAMDTCGSVSDGGYTGHPRHEDGGPPGWGGFDQVDEPVEDRWNYHGVADVILAHSLLRSLPEVDSDRIGITGVSWGGYLTCIVAGVDSRFRFAAPVYGCGFLGDNSAWKQQLEEMGEKSGKEWLNQWDPSVYLPRARMPMLWVTGSNDPCYPLDSWRKSCCLPSGERTLCVRIGMPHGHGGPGENPAEIHAFADALLRGGAPLACITGQGREGARGWVDFGSAVPVTKAELNVTADAGPWVDRRWTILDGTIDDGRVSADVPAHAAAYYFNLSDDRGLVVSSELEEQQ